MRALLLPILLPLLLSGCLDESSTPAGSTTDITSSDQITLGKALFEDPRLSSNGNQSCASCHDRNLAFTDPDNTLPVSEGSVSGLFGTRNTPTITYGRFIPALHQESAEGEMLWMGGLFLDGRENSLEDQAKRPFFNPVEMNNTGSDGTPDVAGLINRLRASPNAVAFRSVFGADALDPGKEETALDQMAQALAAFERTPAFSPFNSRFDQYLRGETTLTAQEQEGMAMFVRADKGNCAACHVMTRGPAGEPPVFTDFSYDNLGVPRNTDARFFAADFADSGLADNARVNDPALQGKFRVPTLRNIDKTAPYMHNGVFNDLRTVVEFYSTRDTDPQRWGDTEFPGTVNHSELGDLKLSDREIDAIVAFMKTLTDQP